MKADEIDLKVMLVIVHDGKLLASKGYDKTKNQHFYRLLGGGVNFQEKAEDAIRREIREELSSEIENLKLLDVVQNIFEYDGKKGHQICFVYTGGLTNKSVFEKETIHIIEPTYEAEAVWVPIKEILENKILVYPQIDLKSLAS